MTTSNELQSLVKVSAEIDESEVKLTFANQCIKAQEDLSHRLKAEIQRRKEICNFKKSDNLKLLAEVQNAEHEIKNMLTTYNAVISANTETKRELLLAKENTMTMSERMRLSEIKYEDLWIQSKNRYETIIFVQNLMHSKKRMEGLQVDTKVMVNEIQVLDRELKLKKEEVIEKERKLILQLAEFFVRELPAGLKLVKAHKTKAKELEKEIDKIVKEQEASHNKILGDTMEKLHFKQPENDSMIENWVQLKKKNDDDFMMPKLHLPSIDLAITSVRLDLNTVVRNVSPVKRSISFNKMDTNPIKQRKDDNMNNNYISCYFNKFSEDVDDKNTTQEDFSKKKLINILEDVRLDEQETLKIMSNVNPDQFQDVDKISSDASKNIFKNKSVTPMECEEIEELDLTKPNTGDVIVPPSQFLDLSQNKGLRGGQQEVEIVVHAPMGNALHTVCGNANIAQIKGDAIKKKVSFDLPISGEGSIEEKVNETNDTIISQLDLSTEVAHDPYTDLKAMILKQHNLDLSPQFTYGKNSMQLQKKADEKVVTSKFFANKEGVETEQNIQENKIVELDNNLVDEKDIYADDCKQQSNKLKCESYAQEENFENIEVHNSALSLKLSAVDKPVAGLLFNHGPHGIPESLDISMSTTVCDDGESDFPTCLDSSLLLSPKADLPMTTNNVEIGSQEVPNFLSGFKKAGLSFFNQNESDTKLDQNKNNENNFSFHFGGEQKKNKGGMFSFFR